MKSPIAIKRAKGHHVASDGTLVYMYWMQARNIPKYEAPFQKVSEVVEAHEIEFINDCLVHTQLHVRPEFVCSISPTPANVLTRYQYFKRTKGLGSKKIWERTELGKHDCTYAH